MHRFAYNFSMCFSDQVENLIFSDFGRVGVPVYPRRCDFETPLGTGRRAEIGPGPFYCGSDFSMNFGAV